MAAPKAMGTLSNGRFVNYGSNSSKESLNILLNFKDKLSNGAFFFQLMQV